MDMNNLQQTLLAVARAHPPDDSVPLAFEQRVMARVRTRAFIDHWSLWSVTLWRAVAPSMAIVMLLCAWTYFSGNFNGTAEAFGADLETAVFAAVEHPGDAW